jgi:hypothetical protein
MKRAQKRKPSAYEVDPNRRRFLAQSASAATGAAIALAAGKPSWYAWAEAQTQRPCLINLHLPGGWDTNWFHTAFPKRMVSDASLANPNLVAGIPQSLVNPAYGPTTGQDPFGRSVDVDDTGSRVTDFYHARYTERTKSDLLARHPRADGHFLGLGAQHAMGGDFSILDKVCIWKGIASGGAHTIPNKSMIHGSQSQYAISYSGLIAQALAAKYGKLQLNYVQLTETPAKYGANWAMSQGEQVPINVPDHDALVTLTQRSPQDFQNAGLYDQLNGSVQALGGQIGVNQLGLSRSKSIYNNFMSFFRGALAISSLGANIAPLLEIWREYAEDGRIKMADMHGRAFIEKISPEVSLPFLDQAYNYHCYTPLTPGLTLDNASSPMAGPVSDSNYAADQAKINSFKAALTTPFAATSASLNLPEVAGDRFAPAQLRATIAQYAWKFALTEFLVTRGYSSVVDIAIGMPDAHGDNSVELRQSMLIYTMWAKLLRRLQLAGYLDRTLVTVFSEFDRTAGMLSEVSKDNRGTGHASTSSVLLAGYGIKQGTVVGDRAYGLSDGPTPIAYQPGRNQIVDYQYYFPTIMKIFGVTIPPQQISEGEFVSAVMS